MGLSGGRGGEGEGRVSLGKGRCIEVQKWNGTSAEKLGNFILFSPTKWYLKYFPFAII